MQAAVGKLMLLSWSLPFSTSLTPVSENTVIIVLGTQILYYSLGSESVSLLSVGSTQ